MNARVAIASGKGGTGKTLVATNLAPLAGDMVLMDLDVEEPDCHVFFSGEAAPSRPVFRPVPSVDEGLCDHCGECARFCEFHAIAVLPKEVMVFDALCHGCGGCELFCPRDAISEVGHLVGEIERVEGDGRTLLYGRLKVGEASAVPLIKAVKKDLGNRPAVVDCPPGTACTAVESIRGSDLVVLVTEPTPFGLHDLRLALELTRKLGVLASVFINKEGLPGPNIRAFCEEQSVPVIGALPFDRTIAEAYSRGELLTDPAHSIALGSAWEQVKRMLTA
jgi:MinD superfamily P-loop ATPase